jgi:CDP-diacylglycerol--serine O-phosphatidyltransferase
MQLKHIVPNAFTLGNMTFGFLAIIAATAGLFERAVVYLFLGVVCDTLDGRMARLLNATSRFGAELDSLSDAISFGVAPAVLVYLAVLQPLGALGQAATASYLICATLRLARFNVDGGPLAKVTFQGVPTPAAAGYMMTFVFLRGEATPLMVAGCVVALALFMVSTLKVPKLGKNAMPGWLIIVEGLLFLGFLYRPSMLTWHIWNGWNWLLVGINYLRLHKQGLLRAPADKGPPSSRSGGHSGSQL